MILRTTILLLSSFFGDEDKEEEVEPVNITLFSSDVYEMEIANCTNSIKGQNRTLELPGRQLIVEAEY